MALIHSLTNQPYLMKNFLASLALVFITLSSFSQEVISKHWISVNAGSLMTDLNFISANGTQLDYTNRLNFLNGIGYTYFNDGIVFDINLDYYTFSSVYQNDVLNTSIRAGYFQPALNLGYIFTKFSLPLKPRVGIGYGHAILINGEQHINGQLIDLKQSQAIKSTDGGININAGAALFNSAGFSITALYNYRFGLSNIENAKTNQETKTRIHALLIKIQIGF